MLILPTVSAGQIQWAVEQTRGRVLLVPHQRHAGAAENPGPVALLTRSQDSAGCDLLQDQAVNENCTLYQDPLAVIALAGDAEVYNPCSDDSDSLFQSLLAFVDSHVYAKLKDAVQRVSQDVSLRDPQPFGWADMDRAQRLRSAFCLWVADMQQQEEGACSSTVAQLSQASNQLRPPFNSSLEERILGSDVAFMLGVFLNVPFMVLTLTPYFDQAAVSFSATGAMPPLSDTVVLVIHDGRYRAVLLTRPLRVFVGAKRLFVSGGVANLGRIFLPMLIDYLPWAEDVKLEAVTSTTWDMDEDADAASYRQSAPGLSAGEQGSGADNNLIELSRVSQLDNLRTQSTDLRQQGSSDTLPLLLCDDLWNDILCRLPQREAHTRKALYMMRATCRDFQRLIDASLDFTVLTWPLEQAHLVSTEAVRRYLAKTTFLRVLGVNSCVPTAACLEVVALPNLDALTLHTIPSDEPVDISPLAACASLTILELRVLNATHIEALAACVLLHTITLKSCRQLVDVTPLAACRSLEIINLFKCDMLQDISPLASCPSLTGLHLTGVGQLTDTTPFRMFPRLHHLKLDGCESVSDMDPISRCSTLASLQLRDCRMLTDIEPLAACNTLSNLLLSGCQELFNISDLAACTNMRVVAFIDTPALVDISALASLTRLVAIVLRGCGIEDTSPLATCSAVHDLSFSQCDKLVDIGAVAALTNLTFLNFSKCGEVQDITPLAPLSLLKELDLNELCQMQDIRPLAFLTALVTLRMCDSVTITDVSPLGQLTGLTDLSISGCDHVRDIGALASLTSLTSLSVRETLITDLTPVVTLTRLSTLDLARCHLITDIAPLRYLPSLTSLHLTWCISILVFSPLAHCTLLTTLDVQGCIGVLHTDPLRHLKLLKLDFCQYWNQTRLPSPFEVDDDGMPVYRQ